MTSCLIIPTYNREDKLKKVLDILCYQTLKPTKVIIVNDGGFKETSDLISSYDIDLIELKSDDDLWWTGAVNLGIQYALDNIPKLDCIILQNDDVEVKENWFEELITLHDHNPEALIGCAAVDINKPDIVSYAGKNMHSWFATQNFFHKGANINDIDKNVLIKSFDLIGRGVLIPVEVFHTIGLYDYQHFVHRGDTEFPVRARKAGYKLYVSFKPLVYIDETSTAAIDVKSFYTLSDIVPFLFDFRSSAFIKYRFYYSKVVTDNWVQFSVFFVCHMAGMMSKFLRKLKLLKL